MVIIMLNKWTGIGRLGADPEFRTAANGVQFCNLRVATERIWVDQNGKRHTEVEWHRVTAFGKTAENINRYCKKGKQLYIEGRLKTSKWQDSDGQDRYSTSIILESVKFLSDPVAQQQRQAPRPTQPPEVSDDPVGNYESGFEETSMDDEIPF